MIYGMDKFMGKMLEEHAITGRKQGAFSDGAPDGYQKTFSNKLNKDQRKMKKYIGLLSVLFILPLSVDASIIYVSPTGNDELARPDDPDLPFLTLQAALDQTADGDTVRIAGGTYPVTPVVVPWYEPLPEKMAPVRMIQKSNITIEGQEDTLIYAPGAGDVFAMIDCTNIVVRGIRFESDNPPVPDGKLNGQSVPLLYSTLHLRKNNDGISISNCQFSGFGNHAISHLWSPKTSQNVTVTDCSFYNGGATNVTNLEVDGAAVSGIGSHWLVESNYVENCQRGFEIECFSSNLKHDIRIRRNTLTNILERGIMLFATCQDTNVPVNFSDITIAHNKLIRVSYGIFVSGGDRIKITDNSVSYSDQVGIAALASFNNLSNVEVSRNHVDNCIERGIQVNSPSRYNYKLSHAVIEDNNVSVTGNSGILVAGDDILVQRNICRNCGWMGMFSGIQTLGNDVRMIGNRLSNSGTGFMKYGIYIQFGSTNNYLADNLIIAPSIAPIFDAGENTIYKYALSIAGNNDGQFIVTSISGPDYNVSLYASGDLEQWRLIDTQVSDSKGIATFTYTPETPDSKVFFRAAQDR